MNRAQFFKEFQSTLFTKEITDEVFDHFDENGNGKVEFKELMCALSLLGRGEQEERLRCTYCFQAGYSLVLDVILCLQSCSIYTTKTRMSL
jgi:EF hand